MEFMGLAVEIEGEALAPVGEKVAALLDFIEDNSADEAEADIWIAAMCILAEISEAAIRASMN